MYVIYSPLFSFDNVANDEFILGKEAALFFSCLLLLHYERELQSAVFLQSTFKAFCFVELKLFCIIQAHVNCILLHLQIVDLSLSLHFYLGGTKHLIQERNQGTGFIPYIKYHNFFYLRITTLTFPHPVISLAVLHLTRELLCTLETTDFVLTSQGSEGASSRPA